MSGDTQQAEELRAVHRLDAGGRTRVRMAELREGDRFTVEGAEPPGVWTATADARVGADGVPVVTAEGPDAE